MNGKITIKVDLDFDCSTDDAFKIMSRIDVFISDLKANQIVKSVIAETESGFQCNMLKFDPLKNLNNSKNKSLNKN